MAESGKDTGMEEWGAQDFKPSEFTYNPTNASPANEESKGENKGRRRGPKKAGKYMKQKVKVRRGRVRQYTNERGEEALEMEESKAEFPEEAVQNFWKAKKTWAELGLREELMRGIQDAGYDHPSKIQSYGIVLINTEPYETLVAQGHTGTGKTATFVIGSL